MKCTAGGAEAAKASTLPWVALTEGILAARYSLEGLGCTMVCSWRTLRCGVWNILVAASSKDGHGSYVWSFIGSDKRRWISKGLGPPSAEVPTPPGPCTLVVASMPLAGP